MRATREPRQETVSFRVTRTMRRLLESLAARLTLKDGKRYTLTDVVEEALRRLAEQEEGK